MSCKRFGAKVFYTLLVIIIFGGSGFVAWSVWDTSRLLQSSNVDFSVPIAKAVVKTPVMLSSTILGVPMHPIFTTSDGSCACLANETFTFDGTNDNVDCFPLKVGKFGVFNQTYQFNQEPTYNQVSRLLVESELLASINLGVLVAGVAMIVMGFLFIFMVICCCDGCCTVKYCGAGFQRRLQECMRKNTPVQYMNGQQIPQMQVSPLMMKAMV